MFTRNVRRMQYPEAFVFQTTPRAYTVWEISIDADTVPADQFPSVIPDLATEMP